MHFIKELFNEPLHFFDKKRSFGQGFLWMLFSLLVFVTLNHVMIYIGLVQFTLTVDPLTALIINYGSIVTGYFVITAISVVPFRLIGGRNSKELFTVVAYSLVPSIFLWIPHILPQAIILVLTMVLMTVGSAKYAKAKAKQGVLVTAVFFALVITFSMLARNYILPFA